jgi:hypothetical protein
MINCLLLRIWFANRTVEVQKIVTRQITAVLGRALRGADF